MKILLEDVFKKAAVFLNKEKTEYIIIGGIAAGVLGEPRVTGDVDVDVVLDKKALAGFLDKAGRNGFHINRKKCLNQAAHSGVFRIEYGDYHLDFIIASTEFEREAFRRKRPLNLYGVRAYFPTPEDFILLKIIPGRTQDLLDAEKVVIRYRSKLDTKYLERWARALSDEAQDMRIWNTLQKVLKYPA